MRRKALWKDFFMEIKKTLNRFLSIFLIVSLGVAFFAGIRATDPDMRLTADYYYDKSDLMDIRVLSTMGLTEEDVNAISKVDGVEKAEGSYSAHLVCDTGSNELVLEVLSLTENLNKYTITEGRLPEKLDEILVDTNFINSSGKKLGDKITLTSGTDQDISNTLHRTEFKIVGIARTPYYLSFQRGNSEIGTGEVDSFIVAMPEVFSQQVYSTVYVSVQDAKDLTVYTDEYDNLVDEVVDNIKGIADKQGQYRYDKLYNESNEYMIEAQDELDIKRLEFEEEMSSKIAYLQNAGMKEEELEASLQELEVAKAEANKKFIEAQAKIDTSKKELDDLAVPKWYVLDRSSVEALVEFGQNAERIGAIGEVFPAIFFLVAALISLTTMTRMVEEQRVQIGTLKALGYSKHAIAMKYMLYAILATLGGSVFGAAVGLKVLPRIIITAYKIMYQGIPKVVTPYNYYYASLATVLAVLTVGIATFLSCYKELLAKPAMLMRPEAPKLGKRVLLERFPLLWNRLNFTGKSTVRNLVRYKKRFFMTIFGIGGCMALLLVGFGVKDSIFVIYTRQFSEIMLYDASVSVDLKVTENEIEELEAYLNKEDEITAWTRIRNISVKISSNEKAKDITMYIPEDKERFEEFFVFRNRVGHEKHNLQDSGVILTEHIAKALNVKVNDTITIQEGDHEVDVNITAITENYLSHYMYMTPTLYENLFEKEIVYNEYLINMPDTKDKEIQKIINHILKLPAASGVFYTSYFKTMLSNILGSLDIVVWVLIIAAGALAFVVLYNLNNININERRRELATLKVLGFYNKEMAEYVYRENIILTVIGILFGIIFGIVLHRFVIVTVEIEMVMFGRNIDFSSYIFSILLTFLFSIVVNLVMYFKLKRIDMVESLKSVE